MQIPVRHRSFLIATYIRYLVVPSSCGLQAHAECDVGKERSVIQQPGLPLESLHDHHCSGSGETLGQGMRHKNEPVRPKKSLCFL